MGRIAIPIYRVSCRVTVNKGRRWSVIDQVILYCMREKGRTIRELTAETGMPAQMVVASTARLMRFRLVEIVISSQGASFRASDYGRSIVLGGGEIPFVPKQYQKRVSFVIERLTGAFFYRRDVSIAYGDQVAKGMARGEGVHVLRISGAGPGLSHEENFNRLSSLIANGWDEELANIDPRTSSLRSNDYMLVEVVGKSIKGLPEGADGKLAKVLLDLPRNGLAKELVVPFSGEQVREETFQPTYYSVSDESVSVVVGGAKHKECIRSILAKARKRVIVHSTFLDEKQFVNIFDDVRAACARGVSVDLLYGDRDADFEDGNANALAALEIKAICDGDPTTRGKVSIEVRSTNSHAKVLLADTEEGKWTAAIGSCNWLSTPFGAAEVSVIVSDPRVVADVATCLQRMVGRRSLSSRISNELAILARELRQRRANEGSARVGLVVGPGHEGIIRTAAGRAQKSFVIGSHRLGSTARPGALFPGQTAGKRNVQTTFIYNQVSGPIKGVHAREMAEEFGADGVRFIKAKRVPMHGKFIAWDGANILVTSLNWASASGRAEFPQEEIGIHVEAEGTAEGLIRDLSAFIPNLLQ